MILIGDDTYRGKAVHYTSYKRKRLVHIILVDLLAMADAFDYPYMVQYDLQQFFKRALPVVFHIDSFSLFNILVHRALFTTQEHIMISISPQSEYYEHTDLRHIGWVNSSDTVRDASTKLESCPSQTGIRQRGTIDSRNITCPSTRITKKQVQGAAVATGVVALSRLTPLGP